MDRQDQQWKPNVTVAAVVEHDGDFLLVEEQTADGIRSTTSPPATSKPANP